jgi:hypothetical protein
MGNARINLTAIHLTFAAQPDKRRVRKRQTMMKKRRRRRKRELEMDKGNSNYK